MHVNDEINLFLRMLELGSSQLYTCGYKPPHNTTCLMFRPHQRVTKSRVPVPLTASLDLICHIVNKSDFFPTDQSQTQDHVVVDVLQFPLLVSLDPVFLKCYLEEDSNYDQSMSQEKSVLISFFGSESSTGRNLFKVWTRLSRQQYFERNLLSCLMWQL